MNKFSVSCSLERRREGRRRGGGGEERRRREGGGEEEGRRRGGGGVGNYKHLTDEEALISKAFCGEFNYFAKHEVMKYTTEELDEAELKWGQSYPSCSSSSFSFASLLPSFHPSIPFCALIMFFDSKTQIWCYNCSRSYGRRCREHQNSKPEIGVHLIEYPNI